MQSVARAADSLASLREAVSQMKQRLDRDQPRPIVSSVLAEPLVADPDSPRDRRRIRQLEALRRAHLDLAQRVGALEEQANADTLALLEHLSGLEDRVQVAARHSRASAVAHVASAAGMAQQALAQRAIEATQTIQAALQVVSMLQSTAYGQRGSVWSTNNLLLAGNQLLWAHIDLIAKSLGLSTGPSPSALAYWAPVLSLVTAGVVLGDRQHVRFISGVTVFDGGEPERLEGLRSRIADRLWPEFQQRIDVPVTAQAMAPFRDVFVASSVQQGTLRLTATARDGSAPRGLRVAWIVDTGEDVG